MLFPEDPLSSPYEVINYRSTLVLQDPLGVTATVRRKQSIRFLQEGVSGMLDHVWGDGVVLTSYYNDAGTIREFLADEGRHHLLIALKRAMSRGETLTFRTSRMAMVGFTKEEEWLETTIDHPVQRLSRVVVFPRERPCRRASLHYEGTEFRLRIMDLPAGRTLVGFAVPQARTGVPYVIRWSW